MWFNLERKVIILIVLISFSLPLSPLEKPCCGSPSTSTESEETESTQDANEDTTRNTEEEEKKQAEEQRQIEVEKQAERQKKAQELIALQKEAARERRAQEKAAEEAKKKKEKVAYLTIDDGPGPSTAKLLDILEKHKVKATFFMLQPAMWKYRNQLKRMVDDGHSIGSHGITHNKTLFYRSKDTVIAEMDSTRRTLEKITRVKTKLIRTPYGSHPYMKKEYRQAVEKAGYKMWDWNIDTLDWKYRDSRMVYKMLKDLERVEKKKLTPIILIHDRVETIKYVDKMIELLVNKGYTLKNIEESTVPYSFNFSK